MPMKSFKQLTLKASKLLDSYFDADFLDIYRNVPGVPERVLMYVNLPCHYEIKQTDNPSALAVDVMPIVSTLQINMPLWIDIQNGDYIIVKRTDGNNDILAAYRGICGYPAVNHLRKHVLLLMSAAATPEEPVVPPPPLNSSEITIQFYDIEGAEIKSTTIMNVPAHEEFTLYPPQIANFKYLRAYLDDDLQPDINIVITDPKPEGHIVMFVYEEEIAPVYFRILANGAFTRNDGSFGFGLHLFKKMPLEIAGSYGAGEYDIIVNVDRIIHPEIGMLLLRAGTILKIFTTNEYVIISADAIPRADGTFIFETMKYTPSKAEQEAYISLWYDD